MRKINWKIAMKRLWQVELWYQDNYRRFSNPTRSKMRKYLNDITDYIKELKEAEAEGKV